MFCNNCGNEIKGNEMFCTKCGARLERVSNVADKAEPHTFETETENSSILCKLIAAISSVLLFISVFVPFLTATSRFSGSEQISVNELFGEYPIVILIWMLFTVLFLIFQLIDRQNLSLIGVFGGWVWAAVIFCIMYDAIEDELAGCSYIFDVGAYLLIAGFIGQIVALVKK